MYLEMIHKWQRVYCLSHLVANIANIVMLTFAHIFVFTGKRMAHGAMRYIKRIRMHIIELNKKDSLRV